MHSTCGAPSPFPPLPPSLSGAIEEWPQEGSLQGETKVSRMVFPFHGVWRSHPCTESHLRVALAGFGRKGGGGGGWSGNPPADEGVEGGGAGTTPYQLVFFNLPNEPRNLRTLMGPLSGLDFVMTRIRRAGSAGDPRSSNNGSPVHFEVRNFVDPHTQRAYYLVGYFSPFRRLLCIYR